MIKHIALAVSVIALGGSIWSMLTSRRAYLNIRSRRIRAEAELKADREAGRL